MRRPLPRLTALVCLATLATLATLAALAGCAVGPDYVRPEVPTPAAWRAPVPDGTVALDTDWWTRFNDPVLDTLVDEALVANKNLAAAAARVQQAEGVLQSTRAGLFPQVGYGAAATRQRATERGATPLPAGYPNPQTSYQALANASWELDLWGRLRRSSEAAQASLLATEEARRGVLLSLVGNVVATYIRLRALDEQLAIAEKTRGVYEESLKLFELQFKYGVVSQINVEQARTQYETAAAQMPAIQRQIAQTELALSLLLGRNPGAIPRGKSIVEMQAPVPPPGVPSSVLLQRPDVRQAEQQLAAATARIGAARALYFPTIALTGGYGGASAELSDLFKGPARIWSFAGSLTGPIFDAGAIAGQVTQAEAARTVALKTYEASVQSAFADVEDALVARDRLQEQAAAQARLVRASSEFARLARLQFKEGHSPYYAVLLAEQQQFPAELQLVQTRAAVLTAAVGLYQALGGGWVDRADRLAAPAR